jgi:hypothetical protein
MKRLILLVALLILAAPVYSQALRVFTESDYNQYKHYSAATAANGDTVVNVVGAQTGFPTGNTVLPYLVAVVLNTMANSASYTILDGGTTVASVTLPATALTSPVVIPYNIRLGTCLVIKIVGTNDVTLVYRTWR